MLHEILFALLGKTGSIIIETEAKFEVNPLISFLSACEKDLINRLVVLGFHYRILERFLKDTYEAFSQTQTMGFGVREDESGEFGFGRSLYLKAFCFAMNEVLKEYRDVVLSVEREFLKNRVFTLSLLNIQLGKYFFLMPEMNTLVRNFVFCGIKKFGNFFAVD